MTLNVDSLVSNKETLEMYVNDREVHVMVIVESNVTGSKLPLVTLNRYSIASKSCREDNLTKGGGGGGVLIYVHDSIPYLPGEGELPLIKGEMEFCSTEIFPNNSYEQPLLVAGAYRPPDADHPPYTRALEQILHKYHLLEMTT